MFPKTVWSVFQQQQPAGGGNHPAPVGGGHGGGGGGGGGGCFSGDSTVETNYGMMKMSDMLQKKNVQVLARHNNNNDLRLTPVQWWLHANASTEMNFVILTTETNQKLAITEYHLIYETDCRSHSRTIFAKKATPGKCVFVNDNGILKESKIVAKTEEIKVGIFAPITESGSIVVNDVLASCFTNFENEFLMKSIYSSMNLLQEFLTSVLPTSLIEIVSNTASFNFVDVPQTVLSLADITKFFSK